MHDSVGPRSAKSVSSFPVGNTGSSAGLGSKRWDSTALPKAGRAFAVLLRQERFFDGLRRVGDLVIAWALLVFTLPLMAVIALAIRFEGTGPILVWQQRIGADGLLFNALRFRTIFVAPPGTQRFRRTQRTIFGAVLWRTHLDGLPMVINVLRGEMTILGSGNRARLLG
jgi:lipopolysaccharide/colanic/teichoic acid biosynthesis glycosyltransferase